MRKYQQISLILAIFPLEAAACDGYELGHNLSVLIGSVIFSTLFAITVLGVTWLIKLVSVKLFAAAKERFDILTVSSYISSIALALFALLAIPYYETIYKTFGADLTLATRLLFEYHYLLCIPFVIVLSCHVFKWPARKTLTWRMSLFFFQIATIIVMLFCLYLPVFKMC